jgi:hypothetical protein
MQTRLQILIIAASIAVFLSILENIRRGRLREEYSLIWLASAIVIFILAVFRGSLQMLADLVQVDYAPSLVFMVGLALVVSIQLAQTVTISKLTDQNRDLAQRQAFLEWHIRNLLEAQTTTKDTLIGLGATETQLNTKEEVTINAEAKSNGDRPRRGHLRPVETVGATREAPHPAEAAE